MKLAITAAIFASLAVAGAANAKATDAEYLKANRCLGLASAETLGAADTSALNSFVDAERRSRTAFVISKAEEERSRAAREARTTNSQRIARLSAELNGACQALATSATTQAQTPAGQPRS